MPPRRTSLRNRLEEDTQANTDRLQALFEGDNGQEVLELDVGVIMPNRYQPRRVFDKGELDELAESIKTHGLLQPIVVRAVPPTTYEGRLCRYEIIAGERRFRANKQAKRTTIPALVKTQQVDDQVMLELAIVENLHRADLNPLDEAFGYNELHTQFDYSYAKIAEAVKRSKGYVQNRMRLVTLDQDLQDVVRQRPDTIRHVEELSRLPRTGTRRNLIARVVADNLSFVAVQAAVEATLAESRPTQSTPAAATRPATAPENDKHPTTYHQSESYPYGYDGDTLHTDREAFDREYDQVVRIIAGWSQQRTGLFAQHPAEEERAEQLRKLIAQLHDLLGPD